MKPDMQRALLATAGRYIRKLFGEVEPRIKRLEDQAETIQKLLDRIDVLEKALADRPAPEKGERGEKGDPGQDAEPVLVADVVAELLATKALDPVLDLMAADAVSKHFEANPVQHGKDGEPGPKGEKGEKGDPGSDGKDGADGIGMAGAMIERSGELVITLTNGTQKSLGPVVGKDGRDGLSAEDFAGEYVPDRGFVIRSTKGVPVEFVLPYMVHRGFWSEGKQAKAGQSMTHDGALWIAKRDTLAKPCLENAEDWILAARKGRDGKDGRNGIDRTKPVKVKPDA